MSTIIRNDSNTEWVLLDTRPQITILPGGTHDLQRQLTLQQIQASKQLVADVANAANQLVVSDGTRDLSAQEAVFHIVGRPAPQALVDGKAVVMMWPTEGSRTTIVSHNWADKTTWYPHSVRASDEVLTSLSPGTTYKTANPFVIDNYHGKLWDEDKLKDSTGKSYRAVVKVGGVTYSEVDPHNGVGQYTIDYRTGVLAFSPSIPTDSVVTASYHYATDSTFVMKPSQGKVLKIRSAEVQFSADIDLTDTVRFETYGFVDAFAPQYMPAVPSGTKIKIGETVYKSMYDFINESNGVNPVMPKIGGSGWRGMGQDVHVFPWSYAAMLVLGSESGMEVRVSTEHHLELGGEFATVTLYCLSE